MVHVLQVESSHYEGVLASRGDAALAGCVCARCGAPRLALTGARVGRWLRSPAGARWVLVALARCQACRARERVLPCDALPSKIHSIDFVFGALSALEAGGSLRAVAKAHGTSRALVRRWRDGVGARMLDLVELLRHRAVTASAASTPFARLVHFSAFCVEAFRPSGRPYPGFDPPEASEPRVLRAAARHLVALLRELGGAVAAARLGAAVFRQAVLLFRASASVTPISRRAGQPAERSSAPWPARDPPPRTSPSGASP